MSIFKGMKAFQKLIAPLASRVLTLVWLAICVNTFAQQPHTLTGDIRAHKSFHSYILKNDREVVVYLPSGYDASKRKRYSVFYMHDGQNLFDGATSFIPGQEWRVDETAERLIAAGKIEPLIIVGVY
ncbi:MAG TPA: alpha/beta hydrolase-fold protein, partial [Pyrinomonadaceae bacterium]|nr:alpha/beta hydrolase-fold protein [Pyrinomonadaceae bacterium]